MTDQAARTTVTVVGVGIALTLAQLWLGQVVLNVIFGALIVWGLLSSPTRDELATVRRRTMHALAALRRRHDAEILDMWVTVYGRPAAEYVPEGWDAPRERELATLDPEPKTEPIVMPQPMGPATVPDLKAAAKVAPLPVVDVEWETRRAEIEADWQRRAAEIGAER